MLIRQSTSADVDRIMDILVDGRLFIKALGIDQWQDGYPYRSTIEADVIRGESYVLVGAKDLPLAVATFSTMGERDYDGILGGSWLTFSTSDDPRYLVIRRMAVSSEVRGCGFASRILREAQVRAVELGKKSVRIDTHPGNRPMRRLIAKHGFSECGIVHASHAKNGTSERIAYEKIVG